MRLIPVGQMGGPGGLAEAEVIAARGGYPTLATSVREGNIDVKDYGTVDTTGATDSTAAITAALAAVPSYISGVGGATVILPPGVIRITSSLILKPGTRLVGAGIRATQIIGNLAGPILTTILTSYQSAITIENLSVLNQSSNAASSAAEMCLSVSTLWRCQFSSLIFRSSILTDVISCVISGTTVTTSFNLDGTANSNAGCNGIRILNTSFTFTSTMTAIQAYVGTALTISSSSFEGDGTTSGGNGAIIISAFNGGEIKGNYIEGVSGPAISFVSNQNFSDAFEIGGNYIANSASPMIAIAPLQYSVIQANYMSPGVINANPYGVYGDTSNCIGNTIFPQKMSTGSGLPIYISASAVGNRVIGIAGVSVLPYTSGNWTTIPDPYLADVFQVTITGNDTVQINKPRACEAGHVLRFDFINTSGGPIINPIAFAGFALAGGAFVNPTNGTRSMLTVFYDPTLDKWVETSRSLSVS